MRMDIITLFPEMFEGPLARSIVGRARRRGIVEIAFTNPREFAKDSHRTVDDRPYGGGPGMVLMAQPLFDAISNLRTKGSAVVYLSPQGRRLTQPLARSLAVRGHLILLCGHYEGIDERIMKYVDLELSIGDYVLTGGELPAMVLADAVARLVPGVLSPEATDRESFSSGPVLDYPHYTRPRLWRKRPVPTDLLTGDPARVETWRRAAALDATRRKRPDLTRGE
ncbi:MAG: tRNA (guanosine(37)-N1)-methyltransferase TrmD [Elusimicrobia bacterium]|nr:tRNA (guanosine(37)-N1)-methyltransferase TrmD [Elusimicrobiota bacterium]